MNPSSETSIPWPLLYRVVTSGTDPDPDIRGLLAEVKNRTEEGDPLGSGMETVYWNRMLAAIRLPSIIAGQNLSISRDLTQLFAIATAATADVEGFTSALTSTTELRSEEVDAEIRGLLQLGRDVFFEDGMENEFSKSLATFVRRYDHSAIDALFALIFVDGKISEEVAGEALQTLGDMEHPSTYVRRRWLFEQCLKHSSRYVRDGAALALSSLNDPHAIRYLKRAIKKEHLKELRTDLRKVLSELESVTQWPLF